MDQPGEIVPITDGLAEEDNVPVANRQAEGDNNPSLMDWPRRIMSPLQTDRLRGIITHLLWIGRGV
jgi:hypothetical protein